MTKQVHIHIHRTKARDAGEGEGRWITLSPSGTHVKIDKGGEITAGPKGMTGKKPSELSKGASESTKPIKHATGQGQSFLPTQPKMGHGSVTKTGSGFTAKNHKGFKEYFKPHEEEKARAYAASGKEDVPSAGKAEGGTHEEDRKHFLNVVRDPKKATTAQLREAIDYWHEVGTKAGHGGQEHAASQQRMRMAASELHARGEKVPGFERPKVAPTSTNQRVAAEMSKATSSDPVQQARQFEEKAAKLHQQAQAEYQKNGRTDEYVRLKNEAQKATNQGTDLMVKASAPGTKPTVNPSSLTEGQALYDKSGKKVDEVESIQRRTLGKGLTINTRAGYQVHVDENGINSQGWSNEKPGSSAGKEKSSSSSVGSSGPAQVKTESYSWGKLTKVGNVNESAIAHPKDREQIAKLDHGFGSYNYTDEQGKQWKVTRQGDEVLFFKPNSSQPTLVAPIREFQDSQAGPRDVPLDTKRTDWKQR